MLFRFNFSLKERKVYILVLLDLIMRTQELLEKLQGYVTIPVVQSTLHINRNKAIYLIHRLRKKGYVKTRYRSDKKRVYLIYPENALGGISYIDILNKYTPTGLKLATFDVHLMYGRKPSIEETLVYALKQNSVRFILAALSLFRQIKDWRLLYKLAKKEKLVRQIAALYDVARSTIPKVRKMPKRFKNLATPKKRDSYVYIIDNFDSRDLQDIENKWKVYIPLNKADLADVKFEYSLLRAERRKR